jgi:hypothetical protein
VKVTVPVVSDVMVAALAVMFTAVKLLMAISNISVRDINRFIVFLILSFVFFIIIYALSLVNLLFLCYNYNSNLI